MLRPKTGKDEKEGMKHLLYIRLFLIKIKPAIFGFFFFGKFIFQFLCMGQHAVVKICEKWRGSN